MNSRLPYSTVEFI